jgi:hypothetical protein
VSQKLPGGTEDTHKKCRDSQSDGRYLNSGLSEYEAGVLTPRPRLAVPYEKKIHKKLMSLNYTIVSRVPQSVLSGYGLADRAIEVRSPAETKGFFL